MKNNTVYSTDGTNFNYDEIEDAIEDAFSCADESEQTTTIYQAEKCEIKLSEFVNKNFVNDILDNIVSEYGEILEDLRYEVEYFNGHLLSYVKLSVDKWLLSSHLNKKFFKVKKPKEITVKRPKD